jgi:hypothetical protein
MQIFGPPSRCAYALAISDARQCAPAFRGRLELFGRSYRADSSFLGRFKGHIVVADPEGDCLSVDGEVYKVVEASTITRRADDECLGHIRHHHRGKSGLVSRATTKSRPCCWCVR